MRGSGSREKVPWKLLGGNHLQKILSAAPVGVMIVSEGRLLWLNRALRRQLDVVWPDVVGTLLEDLPMETTSQSASSAETYQLSGRDPKHPVTLRASIVELDAGERAPLILKFFAHASSEGDGLWASVLQGLESRRGRDPATGVLDRDAVMQVLDSEVARSRRYSNPLSVLLLRVRPDLHAGEPDAVLAAAGRILCEDLRWVDVAGRIADTDFLLLLPETDAEGAASLADKLRARFSAQHQSRPPVAASIAVACWKKGDNSELLLERASRRLDAHKGLS